MSGPSTSSSWLCPLSGSLLIIAVLLIVLFNIPSAKLFTVTSKLTVVSPGVAFILIPSDKFCSVLLSSITPFIFILLLTKVVPSGILSFTNTSFSMLPLFSIRIV